MFKNRRYKLILCWVAVLFWLVLIFYMSAQPAHKSNGLSKGIIKGIAKVLEKVSPNIKVNSLGRFNHYIRKSAHFFCYMVLGILVMNVLRMMGMHEGRRIVIALIICILYAVSDEFHQLFVPGRGAQVKDVIIDSIGAIVGIMISIIS